MSFYKEEKVLEPVNALKKLSGQKDIALVSGCFDVLHFGHINYLRKAKEVAGKDGKLVVVIHDDESIKSKKGEDRPINTLEKRIEVLSELISVDYIVPWYGWENVKDFVMQLAPDFLVLTEGEAQRKNMQEIMQHEKIKIVELPLLPEFSTTSVLSKVGL